MMNTMVNSQLNAERDVLEVLRRRGGAVEICELRRICSADFFTLDWLEKLGRIEIKEGVVWLTSLKN